MQGAHLGGLFLASLVDSAKIVQCRHDLIGHLVGVVPVVTVADFGEQLHELWNGPHLRATVSPENGS